MKKMIAAVMLLAGFLLQAENILTTTSWIKAYVDVAGAEAKSFAPSGMTHPPEYELTPKDLQSLEDADLMIFGGYEAMVKDIKNTLNMDDSKLLQIKTGYNYKWIEEAVLKIAEKRGTQEIALKNLAELKTVMESYRKLTDKKIVVHFHQQAIMKSLGYNVVGVFGPKPLNPTGLLELKKSGAEIIIDNYHGPIGKALQEVLPDAEYYQFMNFPGQNETESLIDVITYNMEQIDER